MYVWGLRDTGALGLGERETLKKHDLKTPKRLSFAEKCDVSLYYFLIYFYVKLGV